MEFVYSFRQGFEKHPHFSKLSILKTKESIFKRLKA